MTWIAKCGLAKWAEKAAVFTAAVGAFIFAPARADEPAFEVIDAAEAGSLGGATGGDEIRKIENENGTVDIIHIYTNVTESSFTVPFGAKILDGSGRILVVAGGGAGGGDCGGGGGAGGVVSASGLDLAAADYRIYVGRGGAAPTGHQVRGGNGGDSAITNTTTSTQIARSIGGGSGGAWSNTTSVRNGNPGGSGGGGGHSTAGGAGTEGQGNAGGKSTNASVGGGGGGAGGVGKDGTSSLGGNGGDGISDDITGEDVIYAAGGGGGRTVVTPSATNNAGSGGSGGIGGNGSCMSTDAGKHGGKGRDGTGSGGGGGSGQANSLGGAGGSGIVVIRYSVPSDPVVPKGATVTEVDGEKVYSFTDTNSVGKLVLSRAAKVDVLVVGGGGAGANAVGAGQFQGGAGGGGAGGFVERSGLLLNAGTYTIMVGAGGISPSTLNPGGNGGDSSVASGSGVILRALGGGGGGIKSAGSSGGSGGGGSRTGGGGSATQPSSTWGGYGYDGGNGASYQAGGGGGGAGGLGSATAGSNKGGAGGQGRSSDITGTPTYYAGGGGGGSRTGTGGAGGIGADESDVLGGVGGGANNAGSGKDGTGSGGGGGSNTSKGGNGGSGIVIIRVKYVMPEPPEATYSFEYDGESHKLYPTDEYDDGSAYTITLNGSAVSDMTVKDVGTYTFKTTLKSGYRWADGSSDVKTTVVTVSAPALVISKISHTGWQLGETPAKPVIEANISIAEGTDFNFVYSSNPSATISSWTTTVPSAVGTYYVTARVNDSDNYTKPQQADIPVAQFSVWAWNAGDKYMEELGYHAKLTVSGYSGEALADFPMLVKISENSPNGFHYKYTNGKFSSGGINALDLRFIDSETGDILPFEVATWNPDGESVVWVKVPTYANGKSVTMCWGELVDKAIPAAPASTEVWSAYAGVWHMDGNATVDASGNGSTAEVGTIASITSAGGSTGQALWNDGTQGSALLTVTPSDAVNALTETGFTVSFWVYYSGTQSSGSIYYFSRRTAYNGSGYALAHNGTAISESSNNTVVFVGNNAGDLYSGWPIGGLKTGEWVRHDIVYGLGTFDWYVNGVSQYGTPKTGLVALGNGGSGSKLYIGGLPGSTANYGTINGAVDEFRMRAGAPSAGWVAAEYGQVATDGYHTWGNTLVTPDSCFKNRWIVEPTISKVEWTSGQQPAVVTSGEAAYGTSYYTFTSGSGDVYTDVVPVSTGGYTGLAIVDAGDEKPEGTRAWGGLEFDFGAILIAAASPYDDLGGSEGDPTTSGRILLVNDYVGGENTTIVDQSYWLTDPAQSEKGSYWIHSDESSVSFHPFVKEGAVNELVHVSAVSELCGAKTIWFLDNVRIGNTYAKNTDGSLKMDPAKNFLPWSPRAKAISSKTGPMGDQSESAHMLFGNSTAAAIYSPCYTNGIGTIYFDAVNALVSETGAGYTLVLEVCKGVTVTNDDDTVSTLIPTDENVLEIIPAHYAEDDLETIIPEATNRFGRAVWEPVTLYPLVKDGTESFVAGEETRELALAINNGGTAENFYRAYATLNYREPVRFRIRRTSTSGTATSYITLDNLIVSYPAMRVDFEPFGTYDAKRVGKRTLGQELAFDVPFPSAGAELVARAKPTYSVDPSVAEVSVPDLVTAATMYYRWRYLDQSVGAWKSVALGLGADGVFTAPTKIVPGNLPGDMEFWYELKLNAPFYDYVDYSGLDLGLADLYTENVSTVSNRANFAFAAESRGKDWFVRLREGASDVEGAYLQVRSQGDGEPTEGDGDEPSFVSIPMELIDNHIWRGYFQTPTNFAGTTVEYRIAITNRQTAGSTELANKAEYWTNGSDLNKAPVSSVMDEANAWTPITVDAVTGYLLFQVDDESKALTIVHADYQNFNSWADAKGSLFVGTSTENDKKSGSAAVKKEYRYDYECGTMSATNNDWKVPSVSFTDLSHMGNRTSYKVFSSDNSDAWDIGQGMWVAKFYKDNSSNASGKGIGLQLAGQGLGYMQLTDRDFLPRGVESVKFNARLAQDVDFERFAYYIENPMSMSNYTFYASAAFDAASNKGFRGNASLSLVAYYRREAGCYEFRVEQVLANKINANNTAELGKRGQSLSLYKWTVNQDTGKLTSELKCCLTNSVHFNKSDWPASSDGTSKLQPLFISITNATDGVRIVAGFRNSDSGVSYNHALGDVSGKNYNMICFRDSSATALKCGSYGVLSANCNGLFARAYKFDRPVSQTMESMSDSVTQNNKFTDKTVTFSTGSGQYTVCSDGIKAGSWYIPPGRMAKYAVNNNDSYWGLKALAPAQSITLFTRTAAKGAWNAEETFSIDGFGRPDSAAAYSRNFYDAETQMIRLAVDGDLSDVKRDVVIDSFEVTQWAGADWVSYDDVGQYVRVSGAPWSEPVDEGGSYTQWGLSNFVFTSGWLDGKGVVLSAKRTPTNSIASVRSPLMDGYTFLDGNARGIGLGMFSFSYENADDNVNLLLQVATNNVTEGTIVGVDRWDESLWTTVTNFNFAGATDKAKGMRTAYIGLHGVKGVMRIVMDPASVAKVANETDTKKFGSIRITQAFCRDEPLLDTRSWWGWNLRTVGADTANLDSERRMYLPDYVASAAGESGLSLALNNSIDSDIVAEDADAYKEHMPFVQTPTFLTNVVGSVTFRARKYDASGRDGLVAVYGSATGLEEDDTKWTFLTNIPVSASTFQTFTYTTDPGQSYSAFRLGVTGVDGVTPVAGPYPAGGPTRVLIDEVLVSEAIRARMAFRNVGAFHTKMNDGEWVPNVPSRNEQPLCNEGWGVQCEVFAAQLKDEIDMDKTPEVYLWYYASEDGEPWGFDNWKGMSRPRRMAPAEGTNGFYRSSYRTAEDAVVAAVQTPGTVVQYMLEVRYWQKGHSNCVTNWMEITDWKRPEWYAPLDYNAGKSSFAAYSIMDTVPPGWAWINEVNLSGTYGVQNGYWVDTGKDCQFVEIAVPQSADMSMWSVRMLTANIWSESVLTNTIGQFGVTADLGGTKAVQKYAASNMVFRVLGSPLSHKRKGGKLDPEEGEIDATWKFSEIDENVFLSDGSISVIDPIAIQLVRPTGIIEHEILCVGTNYWGSFPGFEQYYDPEITASWLNEHLGRESAIKYVGDDTGGYPPDPTGAGRDASLGVMKSFGHEKADWSKEELRTPGRINGGQEIDGVPPEPNGETIIVFANVDNAFGHLRQQVGDGPLTNGSQVVYLRKGGDGTNIVYEADLWFELESVKTNNLAVPFSAVEGQKRRYVANVGAGCSNNVTVIAKAKVFDDLANVYGVDDNDPYKPAIVDWLAGGTTLRGPFEGDEIRLAEFWPLHGTGSSQMTLREMYWLDMDPTVGNLVLRGGMSRAPGNQVREGYMGTDSVTNVTMGVTLYMTNKTDNVEDEAHYGQAWTPYVLRGVAPGEHSLYYTESSANWTSVTFMVRGVLANGYTSDAPGSRNWVPLRWFVFNEDSFNKLDGSEGNPAESVIEVADPYSEAIPSPATSAGWRDWFRKNGWAPIFFNWSINTNTTNWGVSPLRKVNLYETE